MSTEIALRVLTLLMARLCHDLIGPVTAVANGAELIAEEDPSFIRDAVALVGDSARRTGTRLQFYRFAYGFDGGDLAGPPPARLAAGFFAETAIECEYRPELRALPLDRQKLACAMLIAAADALPHGGLLVATPTVNAIEIAANGPGAGPTPEARAALSLAIPAAGLTTRTIVAYHAGLLAQAQDLRLSVTGRPGGFDLRAAPG